jgi:hypothetical protein
MLGTRRHLFKSMWPLYMVLCALVCYFVLSVLLKDVKYTAPSIQQKASQPAQLQIATASALVAWRAALAGLTLARLSYVLLWFYAAVTCLRKMRKFSKEIKNSSLAWWFGVSFLLACVAPLILAEPNGTIDLRRDAVRVYYQNENAVMWLYALAGRMGQVSLTVATIASCWVYAFVLPLRTGIHHSFEDTAGDLRFANMVVRQILAVGAVYPFFVMIEIIAYSQLAASVTVKAGSAEMLLYGRSRALEVGFYNAWVHLATYVPLYVTLANRSQEFIRTRVEQLGPAPDPEIAEATEKLWTSRCAADTGGWLEAATRGAALVAPIIAAIGSSFVQPPVLPTTTP